MSKVKELLSQAFNKLDEYNKGGAIQHILLWNAMGNIEDAFKKLEEWKMSVLISPEAYKRLLQGDLDWLLKQPESLEKDHIEAILKNLIKRIKEGKDF